MNEHGNTNAQSTSGLRVLGFAPVEGGVMLVPRYCGLRTAYKVRTLRYSTVATASSRQINRHVMRKCNGLDYYFP